MKSVMKVFGGGWTGLAVLLMVAASGCSASRQEKVSQQDVLLSSAQSPAATLSSSNNENRAATPGPIMQASYVAPTNGLPSGQSSPQAMGPPASGRYSAAEIEALSRSRSRPTTSKFQKACSFG